RQQAGRHVVSEPSLFDLFGQRALIPLHLEQALRGLSERDALLPGLDAGLIAGDTVLLVCLDRIELAILAALLAQLVTSAARVAASAGRARKGHSRPRAQPFLATADDGDPRLVDGDAITGVADLQPEPAPVVQLALFAAPFAVLPR